MKSHFKVEVWVMWLLAVVPGVVTFRGGPDSAPPQVMALALISTSLLVRQPTANSGRQRFRTALLHSRR
jgi:hypothetical protein